MSAVVAHVRALATGRDGQDLIEYGLLVALIAIIAIAAVTSIGTTINSLFYQTFPGRIPSGL